MLAYLSVAVFLFSAIALTIPSGFSLAAAFLPQGAPTLDRTQAFMTRDNGVMILAFMAAPSGLPQVLRKRRPAPLSQSQPEPLART